MHSLVYFPTIFLSKVMALGYLGFVGFSGQLRDPPKALPNNVRHETHHEEWPGLNSLWYVIRFERWQINRFKNASSVRGWPVSNKKNAF